MILYGYCGMNIGIPPRKGNISSTNCETWGVWPSKMKISMIQLEYIMWENSECLEKDHGKHERVLWWYPAVVWFQQTWCQFWYIYI
jgi:hypothetical protein